ncbi:hypothetical protein ACSSS7_002202 [Eimeria intestinalis]
MPVEQLKADEGQVLEVKLLPGEQGAEATAEGVTESLSVSSGDCESIDYEALEQELRAEGVEPSTSPEAAEQAGEDEKADQSNLNLDEGVEDFSTLVAKAAVILKKQEAQRLAAAASAQPSLIRRHDSEDDFVLNFLVSHGMQRTLEMFQVEWQGFLATRLASTPSESVAIACQFVTSIVTQWLGEALRSAAFSLLGDPRLYRYRRQLANAAAVSHEGGSPRPREQEGVPSVLMLNENLRTELESLKKELQECKEEAATKRLKYEKDAATGEVSVLSHVHPFASMLVTRVPAGLQGKHATSRSCSGEAQPSGSEGEASDRPSEGDRPRGARTRSQSRTRSNEGGAADRESQGRPTSHPLDTHWPPAPRASPLRSGPLCAEVIPANIQPVLSIEAHVAAVTSLCFHPSLPLLATASDDCTWKLWQLPSAELVMTGKGHEGSLLVTTSGDATAKVWSITEAKCLHTFNDHSLPVWTCSLHDQGEQRGPFAFTRAAGSHLMLACPGLAPGFSQLASCSCSPTTPANSELPQDSSSFKLEGYVLVDALVLAFKETFSRRGVKTTPSSAAI